MHEIGIVRQMLRTVTDFAAENDIDDIREIIVDCGELSLVVPEYLHEVYPVVVPGSILSNAKLTVNMVPGMAECNECDEIFNVVEQKGYCPVCGSFDKTILTGREFSIREIVVPDTGPEAIR
jgi:hydrogenase nickel incorporation protein HypA/HybF